MIFFIYVIIIKSDFHFGKKTKTKTVYIFLTCYTIIKILIFFLLI